MISFLRGVAFSVGVGLIDLDVGGVGYRVFVPAGWAEQVRRGDDVFAYTHQSVREDAIQLFGFQTEADRSWFELLIGVSGIGPKGALQLMSGTNAAQFTEAITAEDTIFLCQLPGVGKKTAQRLILELREKVEQLWLIQGSQATAAPRKVQSASGVERDVIEALVALGYNEKQASERVRVVLEDEKSLSIEEALRRTLQLLSK